MASSIISPKEVRTAQARVLENFMPELRDKINKELQKVGELDAIRVSLPIANEIYRLRNPIQPMITEELQKAGWRVMSVKISKDLSYREEERGMLEITMREPLENEKF